MTPIEGEVPMKVPTCIITIALVFGSLITTSSMRAMDPPVPPVRAIVPPHRACTVHWPAGLPVYDHIVIVIEENKDYEQIIGNPKAPYINGVLRAEGASFTRMYGEEHPSQGNYFWLFSGDNQGVGFGDQIPSARTVPGYPFNARNLGRQLIATGHLSFKGYAEDLPSTGSTVNKKHLYARKHVPYVSFANVPGGTSIETSSNLSFKDFPKAPHFDDLPTVSFVIPNLANDMHNCYPPTCLTSGLDCCIGRGDEWLRRNLDAYYQWAKSHNSLLILTFDENDDRSGYKGLTNPGVDPAVPEPCGGRGAKSRLRQICKDMQNRIVTIFAGAHIRPGEYPEGQGITHVNILRTIEAMYGLKKAGAQQPNALGNGIADDAIITEVFQRAR